MHDQSYLEILTKAQKGDTLAREALLELSCRFILKTASRYCQRPLDWSNDDELSISLIAFNEAIDSYDPSTNKSFLSYAVMVIKRRLIDYFRKEGKHHLTQLRDPSEKGEDTGGFYPESRASLSEFFKKQEIIERSQEIARLDRELNSFGLSLKTLEDKSPRHRNTRNNLIRVSKLLIQKPLLRQSFLEKKQLPLQALSQASGLSHKVIKRGRPFIIALALIMINPDMVYLRSYLQLSPPREDCSYEK